MSSPKGEEHPTSISVSEALSGESTAQVGGDATNEAPPEESGPAIVEDPEDEEDVMAEEPGTTPVVGGSPGDEMKEVTLRTAPQDPRFPTTNQSRRCYVAYNEYFKCIKEKGKGHGDCKPHMRAYRSICPDEWIERWQELRDNGNWYGKY